MALRGAMWCLRQLCLLSVEALDQERQAGPKALSAGGEHVCFRAQLPGPHLLSALCSCVPWVFTFLWSLFPHDKRGMVTVFTSSDYCSDFHKRQLVQWLRL